MAQQAPKVVLRIFRRRSWGVSCVLMGIALGLVLHGCAGAKRGVSEASESRLSTTASSSATLTPRAIILTRKISGNLYGKTLSSPGAIRRDYSGDYFLVDRGNHRVLKLDSDFLPLSEFGGANSAGGKLIAPGHIALDGRGNIFLTDTELREIFEFDEELNLVMGIPFVDTSDALKFGAPGGLAVDNDGLLWVSDADFSRLAVFDHFGIFKEFFADYNSGGRPLERPGAMFPLSEGGMVVCDERGGQVVLFNSYGVQRDIIGKGILQTPVDVSVDSGDRIWICDSSLAEVLCFAADGELLFRTGNLGPAYSLDLRSPLGICLWKDNTLAISDSKANKVLLCKIILSE